MKKVVLDRKNYERYLSTVDSDCAFCYTKKTELSLIKRYNQWILEYNLFPFSKFQLIAYPKRHIESFAELNKDEALELPVIYKNVHNAFLGSGIISKNSKFGDQILVLFRERFDHMSHNKGKLAHFHIIFYPRFEKGKDIKVYKRAHVFDTEKLLRHFKS